jgi:kynurenine formamidase
MEANGIDIQYRLSFKQRFHSGRNTVTELIDLIRGARVYDLAQPYFPGMPHYPTHPPFLFSLTHKHDAAARVASASDAIGLSGHTGTHMDALCHFSRQGRLHGGLEVEGAQSYTQGIANLPIASVAPVFRRGVLLDIAGRQDTPELAADFAIAPDHLDAALAAGGMTIEPGDVVLLRTGRGRHWEDPARYFQDGCAPGPEEPGARWLSRRNVFAAGSDTMSFEKVPSAGMPVHAHLLMDSGIHIIECLNLEELARDGVRTFLFVALPLKIRGGTASPIRAVALVT